MHDVSDLITVLLCACALSHTVLACSGVLLISGSRWQVEFTGSPGAVINGAGSSPSPCLFHPASFTLTVAPRVSRKRQR